MYIDFEDYRPGVEGALSVREGVLVSIIIHLLLFITVMFMPDMSSNSANSPLAQRMAQRADQPSPTFVFMEPRVDISKPQPKPNVDASDQDRVASSMERRAAGVGALPWRCLPCSCSPAAVALTRAVANPVRRARHVKPSPRSRYPVSRVATQMSTGRGCTT
jgi:hypothetical protein